MFGTTDNCNTEATERLHIDLAKLLYERTNHKEYLEQMVAWLERQEKMRAFEIRLQWQQDKLPAPRRCRRPDKQVSTGVHLAKEPNESNVAISAVVERHGASHFSSALRTFVLNYIKTRTPGGLSRRSINLFSLAISDVHVWHRVKFGLQDLYMVEDTVELRTAHSIPSRVGATKKSSVARFDTVLVNESGAKAAGLAGTSIRLSPI